jgi:hypothetical protein
MKILTLVLLLAITAAIAIGTAREPNKACSDTPVGAQPAEARLLASAAAGNTGV